jgi:NADPH-dependent ferric siderophore reductase
MTTTAELDAELSTALDETLEHLNANHADTVLLVARFAAGCPEAEEAELAGIDSAGVNFDVMVRGGRTLVRWPFSSHISSTDDARARLYEGVAQARHAAGDRMEITSLEQESADQAGIRTFYTSISSISRLTDGLLELDLDGGLDEFVTLGGDQFFYLMVPQAGAEPIPDGYTIVDYMDQAPDERPLGAYYTVRRWDPQTRRITLWAVLHGHDGGVGGWVEHCAVGDRVVIWGPRHSFSPSTQASSQLLVADETGFAAVLAILDETPTGRPSIVVFETIDVSHTVDLRSYPDATVHWIFRGDEPAGTGDRLVDAVRNLGLDTGPAGSGHDLVGLSAFGAAESRQITAVRKYLRRELGLRADQVFMTGYWRRDNAIRG